MPTAVPQWQQLALCAVGAALIIMLLQRIPVVGKLIRFALYDRINWTSLAVVAGCTAVFMIGAIIAYDPSRGFSRRGPAGGET